MHYRNLRSAIVVGLALATSSVVMAQEPISPPLTRHGSSASVGKIEGRIKNAVTDQYLENAKVSIVGTDIVVFTNKDGSYRIADVPSGPQEIEIHYTGLDPYRIRVEVTQDSAVERDVGLTSLASYGQNGAQMKLDPYKVTAIRDLDDQTVATNEQRYAPNIKNALATDTFGSMMANSIGAFMQYIPGVTVTNQGNANEFTGFSVRGIGGAMSSVTQDSVPMVIGSFTPSSRIFNPYTSDLNNAARMEVTKVPTPADPADTLGGAINLITKSAFDYSKPQGNFAVGVNVSGQYIGDSWWKPTPTAWGDKNDYKALPNASFDYRLPLSKNFGIFVSGLYFPKESFISQRKTTYQAGGTATGASFGNPYMQSLLELAGGPRTFTKTNLFTRGDWRVTQHSILSFGIGWGKNSTNIGSSFRNIDAGLVGTPTVVGGTPLSFGGNFTTGATGRGAVQFVNQFQHFRGQTVSPFLFYRLDNGVWKIEAHIGYTRSYMAKDNPRGPFSSLNSSLRFPVRVSFTGTGGGQQPAGLQVFDNNNNLVDINDLANYKIDAGQEVFYRNTAEVTYADFKINRRLNNFSFPCSLEIGGAQTTKEYKNRLWVANLTYNGPDGNPATVDTIPDSFRMQVYNYGPDLRINGGGNPPFLSPNRVWAAWEANPNLFTKTPAQVFAQENVRRQNSSDINEVVSAAYLQSDARLFNGRLLVLTGVRFEQTVDKASGALVDQNAVFVRNPDGTFAHDPQGARIRRPEAGAVNSLEQLNLTTIELGARNKTSYNGFYPSLHLTYNFRENILVRAAYAKTFGRPDYLKIVPGTTIQQIDLSEAQLADPTNLRGIITLNNTGLKPWTANNYDLSLEYYSKSGGLFTAGVFLKEISNFFGASSRLATQGDLAALGLDSQYLGWQINTAFNSGDARISGAEFNLRQSLSGLGRWGESFRVFANATRLWLVGSNQADFTNFTQASANWGVTFARKRFYTAIRWNYRGKERRAADTTMGLDSYTYFAPAITLNANFSYTLTQHLSLALSVENITNEPTVWGIYGSQTPAYARTNNTFYGGATYAIALKGKF